MKGTFPILIFFLELTVVVLSPRENLPDSSLNSTV